MNSKTLIIIFGLVAVGNCQQLPLYQDLEFEPQGDKQLAQLGSILTGLIQPLFTSLFGNLTSNLSSALTNAFTATMMGTRLELIPVENFVGPEPIGQREPSPPAAHLYPAGAEPPRKRPYPRPVVADSDRPLPGGHS